MTVEEVLKQSGFTDEQIRGFEPKAITAFSGLLSAAEQERITAQQARDANSKFYDESIVPSLTAWEEEKVRLDNERARLASEVAFYRTQNEQARVGGFVPSDAPTLPARDGQGRYVAGGGTPGSPTYVGPTPTDIDERLGKGLSNVAWALQTYQQLHGGYMPDTFDRLAQEATIQKMDFRDYVSRKYDFEGKRQEQQKKQQAEHDDKIRREAEAARDKVWAERTGSNPDIRRPVDSRYAETARAIKQGTLPDPLGLNEEQRRQATRAAIRTELSEQAS